MNIIYKRELGASEDQATARAAKTAEFREKLATPYIAAARGFIDEVIEPHLTRPRLIAALRMLRNKKDSSLRKKHGNIPL